MSDGSDFDDDIDKLLDEIDSVSTQKKGTTATKPSAYPFSATSKSEEVKAAEEQEDAGSKVLLKSDGNGIKVNYGGGGFKLSDLKKPGGGEGIKEPAKAVHFPEDPISSSSVSSIGAAGRGQASAPSNNFLSSLLGDNKAQPTTTGGGRESPVSGIATATTKAPLGSGGKSDWLGLAPSAEKKQESPEMTRRFQRQSQPPGLGDDSTVNFGDDDDDELLRAMGLDSGRKGKGSNPARGDRATSAKPPAATAAAAASTAKPKSGGFEMDDDFWPKPGSFKPTSAPAPAAPPVTNRSDTVDKPESSFRNTLLQKAALARERPESPFDTPAAPRFQPSVTSTPSQPQGPKSIVDVLPFLKPKVQEEPPEYFEPSSIPHDPSSRAPSAVPLRSISPAVGGPPPPTKGTKVKKSQLAAQQQQQQFQMAPLPPSAYIDPNRSTLHLPSHLVDEDELKSMCTSIKSLYTSQLDMQGKSYQDQMECLIQSHTRKEELLREEIRVLHKEYDARLARLKNELLESETKLPQRLQTELSAMANFSQQLQTQQQQLLTKPVPPAVDLESPRSVQQHPPPPPPSLPPDFDKILEDKLSSMVEAVKAAVPPAPPPNSKGIESTKKEIQDIGSRLDSMAKKLEAFTKYKMEEEAQKNMQLIEGEKKLQEEILKLNKQQKKMKESIVKAAVISITQTLEYHQEESKNKKDRISGQLKEFRKDVRRILFDLEAKNDVVHKSHINIESDQKEMLQSLRELQTLVKVSAVQSKIPDYHHVPAMPHPMHQQQVQQAELEIKLLREERNSLSDSIAQMNVERRKLNEEKLSLEREKMDLEREKNRLRDLELQLKIRTAEAEDMKKQAEEIRKTESSKAIEVTLKTAEIEKERAMLKDQFHLTENRLRMREQKLIQEKTELMREKEFLEKLRDQLLCPGCMKSVHQIGMLSTRSDGDGLDVSLSAAGDVSSKLLSLSAILPPEDQNYLQRESTFLDDLFFKQFHTTK